MVESIGWWDQGDIGDKGNGGIKRAFVTMDVVGSRKWGQGDVQGVMGSSG